MKKRVVKFRGKCSATDKWVYGWYYEYHGMHYIMTAAGAAVIVDPETVGQFTGLKDCDGKEIYEGDILDQTAFPEDTPSPREIIFHDCSFRELPKGWSKEVSTLELRQHMIPKWKYKIIGNIHDTPELLKQ